MNIARASLGNLGTFWRSLPSRPASPLAIYWAAFALSVAAFIAEYFVGSHVPQLGVLLVLISFVPCGLAWLLSRELFRKEAERKAWPALVVGVLYLTCLINYLAPESHVGGMLGVVASMKSLIGSAMLLMTFVEAIDGMNASASERRFRLSFAGGYAGLVTVSLLADQPGLDAWQDEFRIFAASLALMGASLAVLYRRRNPLEVSKTRKTDRSRSVPCDPALAARLTTLLEVDRIYLEPNIKVADAALRLRTPDYKVSQCIVSDLGFANFNQLINSYRIQEACDQLLQPDLADQPILSIAMDCGFGSIGPFNRAFKAHTGMTPSAYRRQTRIAESVR